MRQPSSVRSRPGGQVGRVGAGAGLGEPEAAQGLARAQAGEPLGLLLVASPALDRGADQRGLHRDHGAHGRVGPAHLLDDQRVGAVVDAAPAVLLGHDRSEVAHLGQHLDELEVEALVAVVLAHARNDLSVGELAGGLAHQPLLVREIEADHGLVILHDAGGDGRRGGKLGLRGGRRDRPRALRAAGARRRQPLRGACWSGTTGCSRSWWPRSSAPTRWTPRRPCASWRRRPLLCGGWRTRCSSVGSTPCSTARTRTC